MFGDSIAVATSFAGAGAAGGTSVVASAGASTVFAAVTVVAASLHSQFFSISLFLCDISSKWVIYIV